MKVVSVIGARPQFIKAAVVSRCLSQVGDCEECVIHTGQHYDDNMSDIFFRELEMNVPDYHLRVGSCSHGEQTAKMLQGIEEVLLETRPDWMLVYGDTNSTIAGALAAAKLGVPVAHVEAGLRSFNRSMPEEINRVVADHVSDLLLVPTVTAASHLLKEGIDSNKIRRVGDVMYDAVIYYRENALACSDILNLLGINGDFLLATIHRAENTDAPDRLKAIFEGLAEVAQTFPVVVPLHPRTRSRLEQVGLYGRVAESLMIIEPVGYLDMITLLSAARRIVTDSGGLQKEAYFCETPCVTLRDETEWVELEELGWNLLVCPDSSGAVVSGIEGSLQANVDLLVRGFPYGEGDAGKRIVASLLGQRAEADSLQVVSV